MQEYFGVKDVKADSFIEVFPSSSEAQATRLFQKSINKKESFYNEYSEDYQLYKMFEFDQSTGVVNQCIEDKTFPAFVVSGSSLRYREDNKDV